MAELVDRWKLALAMVSDPRLSRGDVACGMHLLEAFNVAKGCAWPSYQTLAERACIHRSNALRSIARLVEGGYFEKGAGGGRGRSNSYRPCFERVAPTLPNEPQTVAPTRPDDVGETVAPTHINSSAGAHKQSRPRDPNLLKNPPKNPLRSVVDVATSMLLIWCEELGDVLSKPRDLTDFRKRAAARRLKDQYGGDLEGWREFCRLIRSKPFLLGAGERGWKADFDWALRPKSRTLTQEGKYDQWQAPPKPSALMQAFDSSPQARKGRKADFADAIARMEAEGAEPEAGVIDVVFNDENGDFE